ncbi:uncharacterized protein LTR77_007451 [Saxophila tyrrhenica]|uniref:Uncharacterized protein n=1 Tax=Saxophila tyrrhenica TaxID=1690608 RepID=A0AAV9P7P3_9PEZI|nr:hypothetical protein LTR77_007451 [Saxophila tyrrhenica]
MLNDYLPTITPLGPSLPPHCTPTTPFLQYISSLLHTCLPTPLAFISNTLGILSIIAWLFAQLPQIYKNYSLSSTSGLSIFFLVEWCLGDLSNLLGALFTHQASWQVAIGCYYVFVDVCLVGQWVWYERLRHGRLIKRLRRVRSGEGPEGWEGGAGMAEVVRGEETNASRADASIAGSTSSKQRSRPQAIFRAPTFQQGASTGEKAPPTLAATPGGTTIYRVGSSSPFSSPSPRTLLLLACLAALAQASPILTPPPEPHVSTSSQQPTPLENAGTALSWLSTALYLASRLPQLLHNARRRSTSGLSPTLFLAAFCGNSFYSAALATNPRAWSSFAPYGAHGWVGPEGSDRGAWVTAALPFFLGAAGVLGMDGMVGCQFLMYGEGERKVVVLEGEGRVGRWRRVRGWMRGWVPGSVGGSAGGKGDERQALLGSRGVDEGYGSL